MSVVSAKITELRQVLAEKFPDTQAAFSAQDPQFVTGLHCLDEIGIPKGAITEVVCKEPSSSGGLLLASLLRAAVDERYYIALLDGQDSLDPQSLGQENCQRLLWVRCQTAWEAVKAADLILRDGNLPFVVIDLQLCPAQELRRLGTAVWFRLQTLVNKVASATCLVLTPSPMVSSARLRIGLRNVYHLPDLDRPQPSLLGDIHLDVDRRRRPLEGERSSASLMALESS